MRRMDRVPFLLRITTMSLRNMNIAPRALLGFALIGALMLALGIFALNQMSVIRQAGVVIEQNSIPSIKNLGELNQLTLRLRSLAYRLLLTASPQSYATRWH